MQDFSNTMLALAGVAQAAKITKSLATTGSCDQADIQTCVTGILRVDAETTLEVFGSIAQLDTGLRQLKQQLALNNNKKDEDIARYMMNLISLERQLMNNQDTLNILSSRLNQAQAQAKLAGEEPGNLYAIFADIYKTTLATLSPRIKVTGSQSLLEQKSVQDKIRTALLFGIRCCVLWRQIGGKRRQLIFKRRSCIDALNQLLQQL